MYVRVSRLLAPPGHCPRSPGRPWLAGPCDH